MSADNHFPRPGLPDETSDISESFTCPFCGLLCDDLPAGAVSDPEGISCKRAQASIQAVLAEDGADTSARLRGKPVSLARALEAAANLMHKTERPLFGGCATDVAGIRAALELAETTGGVVDHMHGDAMTRNLQVMQGGGWMSVNLGELGNRADLVVVLDAGTLDRYPRLAQRFINAPPRLGGQRERRVVTLGGQTDTTRAGIEHHPLPLTELADTFGALRCLLNERPLPPREIADENVLRDLLDNMRRAHYGVVLWSAQSFDFEHGDLVVQAAVDLVAELNEHTRFACLPLAPGDGAASLQQVAGWKCGFPLRIGFSAGMPLYDPYHYTTQRMLSDGASDLLVWLAAFDADQPPPSAHCPQIVLGRPDNPARDSADVFIPVGAPGVDHAGYQFRTDGVVAVPLSQQREIGLPSVAEILLQLRGDILETEETPKSC